MTTSTVHLLLVEDNAADVRLIREALRDATPNELHVTGDGEMALAFLRREKRFVGVPTPDLVLLDLNLPGKDGREVLADMRSDACLRSIPVVVLTTSTSQADVNAAYALGANCYIVKPIDFDQFLRVVAAIDLFWMRTVRLPACA